MFGGNGSDAVSWKEGSVLPGLRATKPWVAHPVIAEMTKSRGMTVFTYFSLRRSQPFARLDPSRSERAYQTNADCTLRHTRFRQRSVKRALRLPAQLE